MDAWWIVLAVVVIAVIGIASLILRRARRVEPNGGALTPTADRDYTVERETSRIGGMSAEDQAWQASSLEKDRSNPQQKPPAS
jgi:membrane protein implicated in regulation of membrane protease activity